MKSFNTRQRANTTSDTIPRPIFNNPDGFPHYDLQDAGQTSTSNTVRKRNNTVNTNPGSQRGVWKEPPAPAFDFQLSMPPEQTIFSRPQENTTSDDGMKTIGMAVGSPTMDRTIQHAPSHAVSPAAIDFDSMEVVGSTEVESSKPKPSKWKKISDFFKAKNSLQQLQQLQQPDDPADRLQLHVRPATSHECRALPADSHLHQNHKTAADAHAPWDDLEFEHRMGKPARKSGKDVAKSSKGKEPRKLVKYVEPPKPNKRAPHHDKPLPKPSKPKEIIPLAHSEPPNVSVSLLNVEIPEVRLERYSVMFGSVLGKPPSTTLLARRSRTLDMLKTHDEKEELEHTRTPLPRRATSPAPARSPTFNLFPAAPTSKPSKAVHNSNFPRPNMPLQRANTAPLSPSRELNEKVMPEKDSVFPQTGTSSMATSSSSRSQWVSEGSSYLSRASTSSSSSDSSLSAEDEGALFSYDKAVTNSPDELVWEILNPMVKAEPPLSKSKIPPYPQKLRTIRSEESFAAITEQPHSSSPKRIAGEEVPIHPKKPLSKIEAKAQQASTDSKTKTPSQPQRPLKIRQEESVAAATEGPHNTPHKGMAVGEPRAPLTQPQPKSETKSEPKSTKPAPIHPVIDIEQWLPQPPPPPQRKPPPTPPGPSPPTIALPPVPILPPSAHPYPRIRPKYKSRPPPSVNNNPNRQPMKAVEVSVARSVSVVQRPKQVIVPMSSMRNDSLHHSDERFGEKRSATPTLISVPKGHKSQEVPIEVAAPGFI